MMYHIYGIDHDRNEKVCLFDNLTKEFAIQWAKKYSQSEYMDATLKAGGRGWPMVYVCYYNQTDVDWDGSPVHEEVVVWSCYREPMSYSDNALEEF